MNNFANFTINDGNCSNYTIGHFNTTFADSSAKLLVLNFNIQCFDTKIDEFSAFLDNINLTPDILVLTETWFSPMTCRELPGYKGYHCTRPNINDRGGVSIFVRESLNLSCTHFSSLVSVELEHVHISLKSNVTDRKNIDIIGIYRPPHRALLDNFFNSLESILNNIEVDNNQVLLGDFNICGINYSPFHD